MSGCVSNRQNLILNRISAIVPRHLLMSMVPDNDQVAMPVR